ncbi:ABC transporter permease [Muricomes intestini]|jgi:peptide/nickel transport system permease protein|uniref:Peptide/nickel transport system permease protein n=1 Tax=Muricomes intestini TaxID=1796634 RepID=A0A4R3KDS8_9FIRM|nr:ABC transporter permease [Muricomes intestini]TCS81109.1 peptide/nickel transport system permease protein [Muricomes intestini]HAX51168.1 peptide ABC transporter [Lachnospiraceae bacterium]
MNLKKFIIHRILLSIVVIFGLSIVIFSIARIVPGDPARMALGATATKEALENFKIENHLNEPLPVQYIYWIAGVLHGDFGKSTTTDRAVAKDIIQFLPATVEVVFFSTLLLIFGSILIGKLAAKHKDTVLDGILRVFSYAGVAMPGFVVAILLLLLFGYVWQVIPVLGRLSPNMTPPSHITGLYVLDALLTGKPAVAWNAFLHILIPAVSLALGGMFQDARLVRNAMVENSSKDYLVAMKGYGIPEKVINNKYLLKPSLIPAVSCMGMDIASLMGNAFLIETIFSWPGISKYGLSAMLAKDLNAISGVIMVFGIVFVIVNIIVDIVVAYLDPRIRLGGGN